MLGFQMSSCCTVNWKMWSRLSLNGSSNMFKSECDVPSISAKGCKKDWLTLLCSGNWVIRDAWTWDDMGHSTSDPLCTWVKYTHIHKVYMCPYKHTEHIIHMYTLHISASTSTLTLHMRYCTTCMRYNTRRSHRPY